MSGMIYNFLTHNIYYETQDINYPTFSLAIDTLEMIFAFKTGKLLRIQGFFPLIKSNVCNINLPIYEEGDYVLSNLELSSYEQNRIYDLICKIPQTREYFEKIIVRYDMEKGLIQIGKGAQTGEVGIKVSDNIICVLDHNLILKSLYICPTKFIKWSSEYILIR